MTAHEFRERVHKLVYIAEVNQLYYQITHTKLSWWDKVVKIGVGALATARSSAHLFLMNSNGPKL